MVVNICCLARSSTLDGINSESWTKTEASAMLAIPNMPLIEPNVKVRQKSHLTMTHARRSDEVFACPSSSTQDSVESLRTSVEAKERERSKCAQEVVEKDAAAQRTEFFRSLLGTCDALRTFFVLHNKPAAR